MNNKYILKLQNKPLKIYQGTKLIKSNKMNRITDSRITNNINIDDTKNKKNRISYIYNKIINRYLFSKYFILFSLLIFFTLFMHIVLFMNKEKTVINYINNCTNITYNLNIKELNETYTDIIFQNFHVSSSITTNYIESYSPSSSLNHETIYHEPSKIIEPNIEILSTNNTSFIDSIINSYSPSIIYIISNLFNYTNSFTNSFTNTITNSFTNTFTNTITNSFTNSFTNTFSPSFSINLSNEDNNITTPLEIPTLQPTISSSISISSSMSNQLSNQFEYYVNDLPNCRVYTAQWCHDSCTHYPPVCPPCCIKYK